MLMESINVCGQYHLADTGLCETTKVHQQGLSNIRYNYKLHKLHKLHKQRKRESKKLSRLIQRIAQCEDEYCEEIPSTREITLYPLHSIFINNKIKINYNLYVKFITNHHKKQQEH